MLGVSPWRQALAWKSIIHHSGSFASTVCVQEWPNCLVGSRRVDHRLRAMPFTAETCPIVSVPLNVQAAIGMRIIGSTDRHVLQPPTPAQAPDRAGTTSSSGLPYKAMPGDSGGHQMSVSLWDLSPRGVFVLSVPVICLSFAGIAAVIPVPSPMEIVSYCVRYFPYILLTLARSGSMARSGP